MLYWLFGDLMTRNYTYPVTTPNTHQLRILLIESNPMAWRIHSPWHQID